VWVLTTKGLLSVVLADTAIGSGVADPDTVMVRARRRSHLEQFQAAHPQLAGYDIIESPLHCDYGIRVVVPKRVFAEAMFDEVMSLGYKNFKSEAHRHAAEC